MIGLNISRIIGIGFFAILMMGCTKVDGLKVGDIVRCESGRDLPPVDVWIGKIESLGDLGRMSEKSGVKLVHLQMVAIGESNFPIIEHSPFAMATLQECERTKNGMGDKPYDDFPYGDFSGGYSFWLDAFQNEKVGYMTISPAEIYWIAVGVLDENGMRK